MRVSPFGRECERQGFGCGIEPLDSYLKRQVSQDIKRNAAACFVLHEEGETQVLGYYRLSAFTLQLDNLPAELGNKLPRYPQVPATLLGRLAISRQAQDKDAGELLLLDALRRSYRNREVIASWAVAVDTINESAAQFYQHFGFRSEAMTEDRLFVTMQELGKLFPD